MESLAQEEQLSLFTGDTLASLLVLPGTEKAQMMTAISGRKLLAYYKRSDQIGLLVKTLLDTSLWVSTKCFLNWKTSATPRNRLLYQLQLSEQCTDETGFSLLPTPTASDYRGGRSPEAAEKCGRGSNNN